MTYSNYIILFYPLFQWFLAVLRLSPMTPYCLMSDFNDSILSNSWLQWHHTVNCLNLINPFYPMSASNAIMLSHVRLQWLYNVLCLTQVTPCCPTAYSKNFMVCHAWLQWYYAVPNLNQLIVYCLTPEFNKSSIQYRISMPLCWSISNCNDTVLFNVDSTYTSISHALLWWLHTDISSDFNDSILSPVWLEWHHDGNVLLKWLHAISCLSTYIMLSKTWFQSFILSHAWIQY